MLSSRMMMAVGYYCSCELYKMDQYYTTEWQKKTVGLYREVQAAFLDNGSVGVSPE